MFSETGSPAPAIGSTLIHLTDTQVAAYDIVRNIANDGIIFNGTTFTVIPHIVIPPIDLSNSDNLDRVLRAIALMAGRWAGKTPAQIKANFLTAYQDVG